MKNILKILRVIIFCIILFTPKTYPSDESRIDALKKSIAIQEQILEQRLKENLKDSTTFRILVSLYSMAEPINHPKANYFLESAIKLAAEINSPEVIVQLYSSVLGRSYELKGMFDIALDFYYKALTKAYFIKDTGSVIFILNDIGNIFYHQKLFDQAVYFYRKGIEVGEQNPNLFAEPTAVSLNNLGLVMINKNKLDSALHYFRSALQKRIKINDKSLIEHSYIYIGRVHRLLGNYDSAYYYCNKVLSTTYTSPAEEKLLPEKNKLRAYIELISCDLALKKEREALKKVEYVEHKFKDYAFYPEFFELYKILTNHFLQNKNYNNAIVFAQKSLTQAEAIGSLAKIGEVHRQLFEIYQELKQPSKTSYHLQKYLETNDSLKQTNLTATIVQFLERESAQNYKEKIFEIEQEAQKALYKEQIIKYLAFLISSIILIVLIFFLIRAQKLKKLTQKLKELNATKDKFFSIIAHDLKNPASTLITVTEFLANPKNELTLEDFQKMSSSLHKSSLHLFALLENLLTWARSQRGKINYTPEQTSINEVIKVNIELLKNTARNKNIEIIYEPISELEGYFDYNTITTVIRNLISNAIKFTPENGKIIINTELKEKFIQFSITDNGVGIPSENLEKIFKVGGSISTLGTNKEQGTGLGLIICKEFVEANGGKIWVESEVGTGSTFYFTVPKNSSSAPRKKIELST